METFTAKCPGEVPLPAAAVVDESARIYSANAPFRNVLQHSASVPLAARRLLLTVFGIAIATAVN